MISIFPSHTETIVTALPCEVVYHKLREVTAASVQGGRYFRIPNDKIFYGDVEETHFQLALRHTRLMSFNPLVTGTIEQTQNGCIIFFTFALFPPLRLLLVFWSAFILITGVVATYIQENLWYGIGSLLILICIYGIAWLNFNLHVKPTQAAFLALLNDTD